MNDPNAIVTADGYAKARGINPLDVVAAIVENRMSPPGSPMPRPEGVRTMAEKGQEYWVPAGSKILPRSKEAQAAIEAIKAGRNHHRAQ